MLTEQIAVELLDWSQNYVVNSYDRPWYYAEPPLLAIEYYQPPCKCMKPVKLYKYLCEDNGGHVYLGQCKRCETIIWSFKEIE